MRKRLLTHNRKQYPKRAFSWMRAGGSLKSGVYTRDGEALDVGASFPETSLGKREKEPHGVFGDGLYDRISSLELIIPKLADDGDIEGVRDALKEYVLLWVEVLRCK